MGGKRLVIVVSLQLLTFFLIGCFSSNEDVNLRTYTFNVVVFDDLWNTYKLNVYVWNSANWQLVQSYNVNSVSQYKVILDKMLPDSQYFKFEAVKDNVTISTIVNTNLIKDNNVLINPVTTLITDTLRGPFTEEEFEKAISFAFRLFQSYRVTDTNTWREFYDEWGTFDEKSVTDFSDFVEQKRKKMLAFLGNAFSTQLASFASINEALLVDSFSFLSNYDINDPEMFIEAAKTTFSVPIADFSVLMPQQNINNLIKLIIELKNELNLNEKIYWIVKNTNPEPIDFDNFYEHFGILLKAGDDDFGSGEDNQDGYTNIVKEFIPTNNFFPLILKGTGNTDFSYDWFIGKKIAYNSLTIENGDLKPIETKINPYNFSIAMPFYDTNFSTLELSVKFKFDVAISLDQNMPTMEDKFWHKNSFSLILEDLVIKKEDDYNYNVIHDKAKFFTDNFGKLEDFIGYYWDNDMVKVVSDYGKPSLIFNLEKILEVAKKVLKCSYTMPNYLYADGVYKWVDLSENDFELGNSNNIVGTENNDFFIGTLEISFVKAITDNNLPVRLYYSSISGPVLNSTFFAPIVIHYYLRDLDNYSLGILTRQPNSTPYTGINYVVTDFNDSASNNFYNLEVTDFDSDSNVEFGKKLNYDYSTTNKTITPFNATIGITLKDPNITETYGEEFKTDLIILLKYEMKDPELTSKNDSTLTDVLKNAIVISIKNIDLSLDEFSLKQAEFVYFGSDSKVVDEGSDEDLTISNLIPASNFTLSTVEIADGYEVYLTAGKKDFPLLEFKKEGEAINMVFNVAKMLTNFVQNGPAGEDVLHYLALNGTDTEIKSFSFDENNTDANTLDIDEPFNVGNDFLGNGGEITVKVGLLFLSPSSSKTGENFSIFAISNNKVDFVNLTVPFVFNLPSNLADEKEYPVYFEWQVKEKDI